MEYKPIQTDKKIFLLEYLMTQISNTLQFTKNFLIQMSNRLSPSVKTELDSFLTTISEQETFLEDDIFKTIKDDDDDVF